MCSGRSSGTSTRGLGRRSLDAQGNGRSQDRAPCRPLYPLTVGSINLRPLPNPLPTDPNLHTHDRCGPGPNKPRQRRYYGVDLLAVDNGARGVAEKVVADDQHQRRQIALPASRASCGVRVHGSTRRSPRTSGATRLRPSQAGVGFWDGRPRGGATDVRVRRATRPAHGLRDRRRTGRGGPGLRDPAPPAAAQGRRDVPVDVEARRHATRHREPRAVEQTTDDDAREAVVKRDLASHARGAAPWRSSATAAARGRSSNDPLVYVTGGVKRDGRIGDDLRPNKALYEGATRGTKALLPRRSRGRARPTSDRVPPPLMMMMLSFSWRVRPRRGEAWSSSARTTCSDGCEGSRTQTRHHWAAWPHARTPSTGLRLRWATAAGGARRGEVPRHASAVLGRLRVCVGRRPCSRPLKARARPGNNSWRGGRSKTLPVAAVEASLGGRTDDQAR